MQNYFIHEEICAFLYTNDISMTRYTFAMLSVNKNTMMSYDTMPLH